MTKILHIPLDYTIYYHILPLDITHITISYCPYYPLDDHIPPGGAPLRDPPSLRRPRLPPVPGLLRRRGWEPGARRGDEALGAEE